MNIAEKKTEYLRANGYVQRAVVLEDPETLRMCIVTDMGRVTWHDRGFADHVTGRYPYSNEPEPPWLLRVRAEAADLDEKIARLEAFNTHSVGPAEGGRLTNQLTAMREYSRVLHERIAAATQDDHE